MAGPRAFVSFDYDHDEMLRKFLVGQAHNERSPFEMADWSVKQHLTGDWKEQVRDRIRRVDKVLVICGEHTDKAAGVSAEVRIAREESKPVYFIRGKRDKICKLPQAARPGDRMIPWTWPNLRTVLAAPTPRMQPVIPAPASPQQPRVRSGLAARAPRMRAPRIRTR